MTNPQSTPPHAGAEPVNAPHRASRGQILIMFAVMLTALLGAVGLSVDLGMAFSQRRTMQSAADAGAYAGTRVVARSKPATPVSAWSEVQAVIDKNRMAVGTITSITCNYVTDSGDVIAPCTATVPGTATGVEVTVQESHPTYFIRVIPGAANTVSTSANARANVKKIGMPTDGPYIPCGVDTKLVSGGKFSILTSDNQIDPAAVDKTFLIHSSQVTPCYPTDTRQSDQNNNFKGLADVAANRNRTAPGWFKFDTGVKAGFISEDVEGPDGCKAGQEVNNCVAFLPIAMLSRDDANSQLKVVGFAPFYITAKQSSGEHYGKLLSTYIVSGKGQDGSYGWQQGYTGPITIRLTK
jgi:Flp pilus assembly protein TadG